MRVSVTIPTFNRAHLVGHAIESVLRQTYGNYEIIVIDDGSTDGTEQLVARYGDKVRYYKQSHGGLGVARNAGLDWATGECVAFLDSDDYWFDFKLELEVKLLQRYHDLAFVYTEFEILKDDGRRQRQGSRTWLSSDVSWERLYPSRTTAREAGVDEVPGVPPDCPIYTGSMYRQFMDEALVLPTTAIVRRDAIGGLRFTERMKIFEDWEFFARLARSHSGAFIDLETAVNRGHNEPGRLTRCSTLAKTESYLQMFQGVWKADAEFRRQHPDLLRRVESAATLAVARAALLESNTAAAREAVARWKRIEGRVKAHEALACSMLSRIPGGRHLLRGAILSRKLAHQLVQRPAIRYSPVNPSA